MAEQKPLTDEKLLEVFATLDGRSQQDAALMRMDAEGAPVDTVELLGARHGWRAFLRAARGVEAAHGIGVLASDGSKPVDEAECRKTCNACWGGPGQEWKCAKAAAAQAKKKGQQ